jgi:hypothetical protein
MDRAQLVPAVGAVPDEVVVDQVLGDDGVEHGVEERHVRAGPELERVGGEAGQLRGPGSSRISLAPRSIAFFMNVAATGWFTGGLAPTTMKTSEYCTSANGLDTAPDPIISSSAATDDAWQRRVQWSTLLVPNPVRTSFWNRYASSLLPLAEPKPARASPPCSSRMARSPAAATSSASSQVASRNVADPVLRVHQDVAPLGHALPADQRRGEALPVVDVVDAEATLHAQPPQVGRARVARHVGDPAPSSW